MVAYASPTQSKLKMPGAYDPDPGPIPDASAAAYVPGKTAPAPAPKANALAAKASSTMGSPYMQPKAQPRNALVADTIDGFMRGFNPEQFQADQDRRKMEGQDKAKQTLALMQQQRALPTEQRGQWWMQNAPVISEIIGQDVGSMQVDEAQFSDQTLDGHIAALSAQMGMAPAASEGPMEINNQLVDPRTGKVMGDYRDPQKPEGSDIRQVGNQIVQRQPDGSWKPVYTGSSPAETARAFQGFIDDATGEQMLVMSDGTVRGTGRNAYVPPQITSIGGVPVGVDKRTYETTQIAPIEDAAGNAAAMASAKVQGGAQGQVAFDLPVIEQRAQTAMSSIADLKGRNIGQRFGLQGKLYAIPGTDGADVQALVNQVTSQAFLNAFEQLKGGGAITEREGQAATAAITRLQNQNITVGEALQAMNELDGYYRKGLQVARERSVKAPVLPQRPVQGQASAASQPSARAIQTPAMQMGIRAYSKQSGLPAEAITEFLTNPASPQEIAEFNEAFGEGRAEALLKAMQGGR